MPSRQFARSSLVQGSCSEVAPALVLLAVEGAWREAGRSGLGFSKNHVIATKIVVRTISRGNPCMALYPINVARNLHG
jgi:hypothetical protein